MSDLRVSLEEIAESISYGHTASADPDVVGPKFLRITDIQDGTVNWDSVPRCECNSKTAAKYSLSPGDIVFARTGATTGKSFLLQRIPEGSVFASYLIRVRPNNSVVDSGYLARFFETNDYWSQISRSSTGTAQGGVNASKLKALSVPLPPLPEQRRIAAILDQADALRAKRRAAIAKCDQLLQSVFLNIVATAKFQELTIQELLDSGWLLLHKDGNHGSKYPKKSDFDLQGVPFLSAKDVKDDGSIDLTDIQYLKEAKAEKLQIGWVISGDVLLAHNATVGRTALYQGDFDRALIGTSLTAFRPNPDFMLSEFLFMLLRSDRFQRELTKDMSQTTRNQVPITAQRRLKIRVPPVEVQRICVEAAAVIRSYRSPMVKASERSNEMFLSLQQRAFTGQLSPAA